MSAFAKVSTQIKSKDILKKTLAELGFSAQEGAKGVRFYGQAAMDLDVYVPQHKFGFVKNATDNTYDLVGDSDFKGKYENVKQKYSEIASKQMLQAQGFTVETKVLADGQVKLVGRRSAY